MTRLCRLAAIFAPCFWIPLCAQYTITTIAGTGSAVFSGDSGPAISAGFGGASGFALDANRNFYFADSTNCRVRKIDLTGIISTVAGNGSCVDSGDNGPAISAGINIPNAVAVDASGNIFIATTGSRIRKVSGGVITTVVGTGTQGATGDNGPATSATIAKPMGVAVDAVGNLYIADTNNQKIRKVSGGIITTFAGGGSGPLGDGGPATSAVLAQPNSVTAVAGNVYITDTGHYSIRKVDSLGVITTVAGSAVSGFSGDGGPATSAQLMNPASVALDSGGNLYIADTANMRIRKVVNGVINTIAGTGVPGFFGDGGPATSARLNSPNSVVVDGGNVYVSDTSNNRIRLLTPPPVVFQINTFAGTGTVLFGFDGEGGPATSARIVSPPQMAFDAAGNLYFVDANRILRVDLAGIITTFAGNGNGAGDVGDGGPALSADFFSPVGVAVDPAGNIYVTTQNHVRKISNGIVTAFAGNSIGGFSGDGGPATAAAFNGVTSVAADGNGNVYIADSANGRVRKVSNGIITTFAGGGSVLGDGGPATSAQLNRPGGIKVNSGNVYIADPSDNRIRKVDGNGIITTIAGNGVFGFSGDGADATLAMFKAPRDVAIDSAGNIYIADSVNNRVRKVTNGIITTVAGTGATGFNGDGIPASVATIYLPIAVATNSAGNVLVSDLQNNRIRILSAGIPNLISLSPNSIGAGTAGMTITVNGTGFLGGDIVQWNGTPLTTTFVSYTQVTAVVGASLLTVPGTAAVTVSGSNALTFTVRSPVLNSLSPTTAAAGSAGFTLTVTGSSFSAISTVQFGATPLTTTFVSTTQLTAVVPGNLLTAASNPVVTVVSATTTSNGETFVIGTPALSCSAASPSPALRFEGLTELLGDVVVNCTGTAPVTTNIAVTSSVSLTSRTLNSGTKTTEVLLLIGDPAPAQQVLNTNVFQGVLTSANTVTFNSIPIAGTGARVLRIVNLRGNAHELGQFSPKAPSPVNVFITMSGAITVNNPQVSAGFPSPTRFQLAGNISSLNDKRTAQVRFLEGFAGEFKTRVAAGGNQSAPGTLYNTESGFVNTALLPTAGLADSGTRLILQFTGVPPGVNAYVTVAPTNSTNAQLVSTDANGAGPTSVIAGSALFGGTYSQVSIDGSGKGIAVWEVTAADPAAVEALPFLVVFTGMTQPGLGPVTLAGAPAPLSIATGSTTADPLPRFAADSLSSFVDLTLLSASTATGANGNLIALPSYRPSELLAGKRPKDTLPQVQVGSNLGFTYNVVNNGPGPANQVTVSTNLPSSLSYLSCSTTTGGICAATPNPDGSTTVTRSFTDPLQPGQPAFFTVNAQPLNAAVGTTVNVTTVVSSGKLESFPDDNTIITSFGISSTAPPAVTVNFTTNPAGLQIQVGASAPQAAPSVTLSQSATVAFSAPTPQAGTAGVQYVFNSWGDGVTTAAHPAITPPLGGGTFAAKFDTQYQVTATASVGGSVSLSPTAAGNFYTANTNVLITPQPASGFTFTGFTGDITASTNPLNLVMPAKPISLRANFAALALTLSPGAVAFGATPGGALTTSPQTITVQAPASANWSVSANQQFISVSPASGTGNGSFTISMVGAKLPASGTASGVVTVTSTGVTNSPQTVNVSVAIGASTMPFGSFDTPADGATGISGAVAVTGWALDSLEVTSVEIWREPVGSEPVAGNGLVFIGNVVFVAGARPDVQAANPTSPFSNRAGWGYLLLTTGLPGATSGNGTYKLHAIAHNKGGTLLDLGTKTITVDNAHSTKPFGTIDTPDQGGTISGTQFINFGWSLAQNPNCIPTDGSTMTVTVDGVTLGHPTYNQARSDLAAAFPGRCNSAGAAGYFFIDTTQFSNGVHTIGWLSYDNKGNGDGLGSRFFNVLNNSTPAASPANEQIEEPAANLPDHVEIEELGRVELHVGAVSGSNLPAGSTLKRGVFYWQLAPGFLGNYDLEFMRPDQTRVKVRVQVRPKAYKVSATQ